MKVVIISKSDLTGGAAVVSFRLMNALREAGVDARMLVAEKRSDSEWVKPVASKLRLFVPFVEERLKIYLANGMNYSDLFKVDSASDGVPLWRHPWVHEADVVCLGWVNQGLLSLRGLRRLGAMGKPIVWTMHDMWCATGICHHAGTCEGFREQCGSCPLLGRKASPRDLSRKVWEKKSRLWPKLPVAFVAVSGWLEEKARQSSLLKNAHVTMIPNAFPLPEEHLSSEPRRIIAMGAARLDDPVKGLPSFVEMTRELARRDPENKRGLEVVTFGGVKDPSALEGIGLPHRHLGVLSDPERVWRQAAVAVSASSYETLPGTLIEGQASGAVPVSFDRGGQRDIVDHLQTGWIASYSGDTAEAGRRLADGVEWALEVQSPELRLRMRQSVMERFSAPSVAKKYISLFNELLTQER